MKKTREKQYQKLISYSEKKIESLGLMSNQCWIDDPRRFTFMLSRYKFVSKLFSDFNKVLEVGCGDAFASRIVCQTVNDLTVSDFDPLFIDDITTRMNKKWPIKTILNDFTKSKINDQFDGIYSLDVLEHIPKKNEKIFLKNVISSLNHSGVLILGMPSLESQKYASKISKEGHVNCKSGNDFKKLMLHFFNTVFLFSMNDEVVHTGYEKMAHYLFVVCTNKK
jgi:2-polyprenyl-3-methyl-5-hydroxy-6-metoxy-1,4-benzoquinol methylase